MLAESHALWGAGLTVPDYVEMWEELAASRWGRSWYSWRALVDDDGRVLSSLKLYRPALSLGGAIDRTTAIGAVYTPRAARRRGHGAALILATLEEAESRGDRSAILFTDIGTEYYNKLGFVALPCEDAIGTLADVDARADGRISFREMKASDLDAVVRAHDATCVGRPIAIARDRDHWEFLLLRAATFFRRLDGSDLSRRFMIATESGRAIGYLVAVLGSGEWNLREVDAFDGRPATVARILGAGAATASADSAATVWGWIPRGYWALVPTWRLRPQPRVRAIPMIRPLSGRDLPGGLDTLDGAFVPYLDQF